MDATAGGQLRCESQPTLWGHAPRVPGRGWRGACAPSDPPQRQRHIMGSGRDVWVKIRASEAGHAELHAMSLTVGEIVSRAWKAHEQYGF